MHKLLFQFMVTTRTILAMLALLCAFGCSSVQKSHPFEAKFYVTTDVPLLSESEWRRIRDTVDARDEFVFDHAVRRSDELIEVCLLYKEHRYGGVYVYFELRDGQWVENKEKEIEFTRVGRER